MRLQLHHPKLLVLVLLAIAVATTVSLLFVSGPGEEEGFTPIPIEEPLPTLTEDEIEKALSIIKESGVVKTINDNQDWTYELVHPRKYNGFEGAGMDVVWSGPSVLVRAVGTHQLPGHPETGHLCQLEQHHAVGNARRFGKRRDGHFRPNGRWWRRPD